MLRMCGLPPNLKGQGELSCRAVRPLLLTRALSKRASASAIAAMLYIAYLETDLFAPQEKD